MQIDCYGLREHPFKMSPDARLYFASKAHSRAYAHLLFGLSQKEGFIVVTGEVGAGKTTLIERLCAELPAADHAIARVMTTQVEADDLLRLVAVAFGAEAQGSKAEILRAIVARLWEGISSRGMRYILIVDEAQALPVAALEELRMLSNITEGERALLQVVLMGQPQLRRTLARADLDQLRQRILAAYHLGSLTLEETHQYVRHRMTAVGWTGTPEWQPGALDVVHRYTDGIPRRINRLCSRILLSGSLEGRMTLTAELAEATALELDQDLGEIVAATEPEPEERGVLDAIRALEDRITNLEHLTAGRERLLRRIQDLVDRAEAARAAQ